MSTRLGFIHKYIDIFRTTENLEGLSETGTINMVQCALIEGAFDLPPICK